MADKSQFRQIKMEIKSPDGASHKKDAPIRDYINETKRDKAMEERLKSIEAIVAKHSKEIELIERILTSRGNRR